ncbi:hypothetical protein HPB50_006751 [Hyalomma asiaticum]|uniref:Uncharacterized protein n=1 Tax=Hyalomma asiaticum TaxID=266040 RepID=A0ACB7TJK1_HYAAI|nr:hypothetical protein HPB50_006751 [Hyalomma asiaticum]
MDPTSVHRTPYCLQLLPPGSATAPSATLTDSDDTMSYYVSDDLVGDGVPSPPEPRHHVNLVQNHCHLCHPGHMRLVLRTSQFPAARHVPDERREPSTAKDTSSVPYKLTDEDKQVVAIISSLASAILLEKMQTPTARSALQVLDAISPLLASLQKSST